MTGENLRLPKIQPDGLELPVREPVPELGRRYQRELLFPAQRNVRGNQAALHRIDDSPDGFELNR